MQNSVVLFPGYYGEIGQDNNQPALPFDAFVKDLPVLYGQIIVNKTVKIGCFKATWNKYSNSMCYQYYTPQGNKGKGGFTLRRAYSLLQSGGISTNPKYGNPDTYVL